MSDAATADTHVLPIDVGDRLPNFPFQDHTGKPSALDHLTLAGKPVVIFLCPAPARARAQQEFRGFTAQIGRLAELGVSVLAVGAFPISDFELFFEGRLPPYAALSDPEGKIAAYLGLPNLSSPCTLITGPDLRVARIIAGTDSPHADAVITACAELCRPVPETTLRRQAPVLIVDNAFPPAFCARLIQFWESRQKTADLVASASDNGNVNREAVKRRADVAVEDPVVRREVEALIQRRVLGEIKKAFHFAVRTGETMKIGCYDAAHGGMFKAHRDNNAQIVAHRRFAMSLLLNDAYEGGTVSFPEFPGPVYRPDAGAALIFSCSLLHAVAPVTKGRRFGLFGFFW